MPENVEDIVDPRIIVKKKSNNRYINGVDLHNSLVNFYNERDNNPNCPIPEYIGECISQIAKNLSSKINFSSYTFKEEMVGDAVLKMMEAVVDSKYDADISKNPFAYFSQISWNSFLQRIAKEKKEAYVIHKNLDNMFMHEDLGNYEEDDYRHINTAMQDENHNRIIEQFEKPKEKNNNYAGHKNLSYLPNRQKKGRKKKEVDIGPEV